MLSCSFMRTGSLTAIPSAFDIKSISHFIKRIWLSHFSSADRAGENKKLLDPRAFQTPWRRPSRLGREGLRGPWGLEQVAAGHVDDLLSWSPGLGNVTPCKPLQSTAGRCLLWHHPLLRPRNWRPESGGLNAPWAKQETSSTQVPAVLVVTGLRKPETIHPAPHSAPGSMLCLRTSPVPWAPPRWPTDISLLFFHSLLFHGKLNSESVFTPCWATTGSFRFPVTPNTRHHDLPWESPPGRFCTGAKQHFPDGKRTRVANGLKQSASEAMWGLPRWTVPLLRVLLSPSNSMMLGTQQRHWSQGDDPLPPQSYLAAKHFP